VHQAPAVCGNQSAGHDRKPRARRVGIFFTCRPAFNHFLIVSSDFEFIRNVQTEVDMGWTDKIAKIWHDQTAATAVEYGLILALIFLAMIGALQAFGASFIQLWDLTSDTLVRNIGA
jgi:pilus assembly protein Flp/PilA